VDALNTQYYDAILMDCSMPEMNGFDATRQIRLRHGSSIGDHRDDRKRVA